MKEALARGKLSYFSGQAAEQRIAQEYERRGFSIARQRWQGAAGEIDLIAKKYNEVVFVEVKKSSTPGRAAERLSEKQMQRIYSSAAQFLEQEPLGQLTPSRFDVALVNGQGGFEIIENAFGQL